VAMSFCPWRALQQVSLWWLLFGKWEWKFHMVLVAPLSTQYNCSDRQCGQYSPSKLTYIRLWISNSVSCSVFVFSREHHGAMHFMGDLHSNIRSSRGPRSLN
jgi:hypothetical protein